MDRVEWNHVADNAFLAAEGGAPRQHGCMGLVSRAAWIGLDGTYQWAW